jgi:hypothetical protein
VTLSSRKAKLHEQWPSKQKPRRHGLTLSGSLQKIRYRYNQNAFGALLIIPERSYAASFRSRKAKLREKLPSKQKQCCRRHGLTFSGSLQKDPPMLQPNAFGALLINVERSY